MDDITAAKNNLVEQAETKNMNYAIDVKFNKLISYKASADINSRTRGVHTAM